LVIAMVVTLACLPALLLELMGGQDGGSSSDVAVVSTDAPQSSLVVAVSPSEPTTTVAPSATASSVAPPTTVAPSSTKKSTTTTAPKVAKSTAPTTTAPPKTYAAPPTTAAPAPSSGPVGWEATFLACVRYRESRNLYTAVDPSGTYMGAYQIYQVGWDTIARNMGRTDLVGVKPNHASPADQDAVALAMLRQLGTAPWGGSCR
jgi:hypothetical protein